LSIQMKQSCLSAALLLALVICLPPMARAELMTGHGDRIGLRAEEWGQHTWLNSPPLTLGGLKGKVVLVRWWTDGCPFCARTAPALNALHRRFASRGLVVIGMYHPKPPRDASPQSVARAAKRLGFAFPIALDNDWATLRRWWLDSGGRDYTSVTFLIDRAGLLRAIHPGGEFHVGGGPEHAECARDYTALQHEIERLLGGQKAVGSRQ
jgi:thiol-disulfide isomerase/thioredoxin